MDWINLHAWFERRTQWYIVLQRWLTLVTKCQMHGCHRSAWYHVIKIGYNITPSGCGLTGRRRGSNTCRWSTHFSDILKWINKVEEWNVYHRRSWIFISKLLNMCLCESFFQRQPRERYLAAVDYRTRAPVVDATIRKQRCTSMHAVTVARRTWSEKVRARHCSLRVRDRG